MLTLSSVRLNKYISDSGICSRREADREIKQGHVLINNRPAAVGAQVFAGDVVTLNGRPIAPRDSDDVIVVAFNKPVGVICTTDEREQDNIVTFVNHSRRVFPVGRLDKASQGLILLTNHGDLFNKILRAGNGHEKEYRVTVDKPVTDAFIHGLSAGVPMLGTVTKPCRVTQEAPCVLRITLIQGLNRQIRRMCKHFGYAVTQLERIRIMNIHLQGIASGEWRDLTAEERGELLRLTENSSSAEQAET